MYILTWVHTGCVVVYKNCFHVILSSGLWLNNLAAIHVFRLETVAMTTSVVINTNTLLTNVMLLHAGAGAQLRKSF